MLALREYLNRPLRAMRRPSALGRPTVSLLWVAASQQCVQPFDKLRNH